jgi:thioredoxin 1
MSVLTVTDSNFEQEVLKSDKPVLVDFWASWCGPCKAIAPVLEELAEELSGQVAIAKVNIDENQDMAVRYRVRSIPTLLLFKGGQVVDTQVGSLPKAQLKAWMMGKVG